MFYSSRHGGWVFPAEDRMPPRVLREKAVAPLVWTFCPFCGRPLTDEGSAPAQEREVWQDADDG